MSRGHHAGKVCTQGTSTRFAMVAGNMIIELAKIGGITPLILIFSGRWLRLPAHAAHPDHALGIMDRHPALTTLHKDDRPDDRHHDAKISSMITGDMAPVLIRRMLLTIAAGMLATIPAKMIREMPLPIPRSVICSPSHMMKAVPAVRVMTVRTMKPIPWTWNDRFTGRTAHALQADGNPSSLDDRQNDRAVAGPAGDGLAPLLTLLGQSLHRLQDHRQQLQDDRSADVRHDAKGEDRHPLQRATGKRTDQPQQRPFGALKKLRQDLRGQPRGAAHDTRPDKPPASPG